MTSFQELPLKKALLNAVIDLKLEKPTPIQIQAFPKILSGQNIVGIAQTGTGKTFAYLLPILQELKFSKGTKPRVVIIVPTRELVVQVIEQINLLTRYITIRTAGVFGGVNIKTQQASLAMGTDIIVGTPGRLYDLTINRSLMVQDIKKLIIDEVDVLLDLGFRFQLNNLFELLPSRRQNIMFSATMTDEVDHFIQENFIDPQTITVAISGTPLENIIQSSYKLPNFYTKVNFLIQVLKDKTSFEKVVIFMDTKKNADRLFEALSTEYWNQIGIINSNKSQNNRLATIEQFNDNFIRILIATDVIARGLDFSDVSHVISFDTPKFAENYIHRIGRTGRAKKRGQSLLLSTPSEESWKKQIEELMGVSIPIIKIPTSVEISNQLTPDEQPRMTEKNLNQKSKRNYEDQNQEKKNKNKKEYNVSGGQKIKMKKAKKYKKPLTKRKKPRKN